jgi:hypothetical protein
MMSIAGLTRESLILREDVMQRPSIFQKRRNLIFIMLLDLELFLKMLALIRLTIEELIGLIAQLLKTPELAIPLSISQM